ncbi:GNAT family N-acetyltransferase [Fibrella aquatilis]|uniref:GNAT family N-acetyltransferase n=1 Tax=Fibrella aquatilis TaxID=2817059 RepID=A0A939G0F3_9BACT|nr:GNAT family N-acetyltransferase [Fibrella aquatilis]MBO0930102.1 GNAT family N-acetyltransferase [Fibrella aquatilis]
MIETNRLSIRPLTLEQLRLHLAGGTLLEDELGALPGHREVTEPLLSILKHFTIPFLQNPNRQPLYDTIWIARDRTLNQFVADAKFKGAPDEEQTIEIGYGTYPTFQGRGYMTELVGGLVTWALNQPGVRRVTAETDLTNAASQAVLRHNSFHPFAEDDRTMWWELAKGIKN